jgi:hypothetical protein
VVRGVAVLGALAVVFGMLVATTKICLAAMGHEGLHGQEGPQPVFIIRQWIGGFGH